MRGALHSGGCLVSSSTNGRETRNNCLTKKSQTRVEHRYRDDRDEEANEKIEQIDSQRRRGWQVFSSHSWRVPSHGNRWSLSRSLSLFVVTVSLVRFLLPLILIVLGFFISCFNFLIHRAGGTCSITREVPSWAKFSLEGNYTFK